MFYNLFFKNISKQKSIFNYKKKKYAKYLNEHWKIIQVKKMSAFSYVASGGYKKKQLYPTKWYSIMKKFDKILDIFPILFSTRILIVLEKK